MWRTTLKGLAGHKIRLFLTALAVVLGVGFVSGTFVLTDTLKHTFDDLITRSTAGVDVFVRKAPSAAGREFDDRGLVPLSLLSDVRRVDGVSVAQGTVSGFATMLDKTGKPITSNGPPTLGVGWIGEPLTSLTVRSGRGPLRSNEVMIDAATAKKFKFKVGDPIKIITLGPAEPYTIVGIAGFGEADNLAGATLSVFDLNTAEIKFNKTDGFDAIEVGGSSSLDPDVLRRRIQTVLPGGFKSETGTTVAQQQARLIQKNFGFFNIALLIFAGVSLFVGGFIIFNTFSIIVAQRTREFGLLKALGAKSSQVLASVIVESAIVATLASVAGIGFGVLVAQGIQQLLKAFGASLPQSGLQFLPHTVWISMTVGLTVTMLSAVIPARKAARIAPMAALREFAPAAERPKRSLAAVGLILAATGIGIFFAGLFAHLAKPAAIVGIGAVIIFLGVAALSPFIAGTLARVIGSPLPVIFHMPGRLARLNAARNPRRTAATSSALMIGMALVSLVAIFAASLKASASDALDKALRADFIITNKSFGTERGFSAQVAERLNKLDQLSAAVGIRDGSIRIANETKDLVAFDPSVIQKVIHIKMVQGQLQDLRTGFFIKEATAKDLHLAVGDKAKVEFLTSGKQELTVTGIFESNPLLQSEYLLSLGTYDANFRDRFDSGVLAKIAPGVKPKDARKAIRAQLTDFPTVAVRDQTEFKARQAAQINRLLGLVTALLGLALVIALLGITNTLALSVFERTRELGLLRAVGMTRRQTRTSIRWESVIVSVIGAVLGLAVGVFFGWGLVTALKDQGMTVLAIPGVQLAAYIVAAAFAGVFAAIPPARRAARLDPLQAIATE